MTKSLKLIFQLPHCLLPWYRSRCYYTRTDPNGALSGDRDTHNSDLESFALHDVICGAMCNQETRKLRYASRCSCRSRRNLAACLAVKKVFTVRERQGSDCFLHSAPVHRAQKQSAIQDHHSSNSQQCNRKCHVISSPHALWRCRRHPNQMAHRSHRVRESRSLQYTGQILARPSEYSRSWILWNEMGNRTNIGHATRTNRVQLRLPQTRSSYGKRASIWIRFSLWWRRNRMWRQYLCHRSIGIRQAQRMLAGWGLIVMCMWVYITPGRWASSIRYWDSIGQGYSVSRRKHAEAVMKYQNYIKA